MMSSTHPVTSIDSLEIQVAPERRLPPRRPRRPGLQLAGAVVAATSLLLGACSDGGSEGGGDRQSDDALAPEGTATTTPQPLVFDLIGECDTNGGVLRANSDNFTPGGGQEASATVDGQAYPGNHLITDPGPNTDEGKLHPGWQWDCGYGVGGEPDPAGTYTVTVEDLVTGRRASDTFVNTQANP